MSAAVAEKPAVLGALHLPHPLQHIPAFREEGLVAALLHCLDGTGTGSQPTPTHSNRIHPPYAYHHVYEQLKV